MTARDRPDTIANPWSARIAVVQIPETGLHRDIEADEAVRKALAKIAGLRDIQVARASFDLTPGRHDSVHVRGRVTARVGQVCVVSLDPVENDVVEDVDLVFVPESRIPALADSVDEDDEGDTPHSPEPILNGVIDLGRLATDALFLGIDPYPRKPDAVFEAPSVPEDPEDHPFAALKALKGGRKPPKEKKP